jgi:hypothetical protein
MVEMFWTGVLFGTCVTLLLVFAAVAIYVRVRGAFIIGPPEPPVVPIRREGTD